MKCLMEGHQKTLYVKHSLNGFVIGSNVRPKPGVELANGLNMCLFLVLLLMYSSVVFIFIVKLVQFHVLNCASQ